MNILFVIFITVAVYGPFAFFFLELDDFSINEYKAKRRNTRHQRTTRKYKRIIAKRHYR